MLNISYFKTKKEPKVFCFFYVNIFKHNLKQKYLYLGNMLDR